MDKTFRRYVEIARSMRSIGSNSLDISNLNEKEAYIVTALVKNDAIFQFFDECKDIDARKLYVAVKLIEAEEAYRKVEVI